ncbi:serine/threonine-protein kinase [Mobilisporobacter senegalensis]|uniref:non-specific serine/threonine protein kinase n=1 Tax=Mobilisporobacter senegalensis TaxID=1329262 RepID=A0A3N1XWR0_9FIRM|nr:Stk1 family PASTA domain-containing Ser/Thr kinase [Mobilisporobacter senegalensis]ROR30728.1 serine/threonine-protein kinase [Mobilisporobacter senegalensis]
MVKPGMFISERYEIIDKVGTGGMADVYKAKCHRLNRFVAIKILKPEYSDDKSFVSKFRAEAQSVAGLSHPNIVNVYDVGEEAGLHYIVMELVEGITLKNFIERKGKLEIKEAVGIGIQIAQGMEAAHDNHIIHRDIKPQNIIISREGKVKVTDFGIAKAASSNTISSNTMGSVHYISPEQARGGYSDEKSDIYSLGVTLYEMLSGRVPFVGDNSVSVALLHIQEEATPLRELEPSIPISVENIVQKCMQKKPERRYLSAHDLIIDLKRSITNPNGDFVKIPAAIISDSPTINLSDEEVRHIKNESKINSRVGDTTKIIKGNTEDGEEEESEVDPKLEKIMVTGSIVAAVILCLIIIFLVGKTFGLFKLGGTEKKGDPSEVTEEVGETTEAVTAPEVTGKKLEDAIDILRDQNIGYKYEYQYSDVIEKDIVMEQSILPGNEIKAGDVLILTVSDGPKAFEVPDVYNRLDEEAITILEEAKLVVKHEFEFSDTVDQGRVIRTNPERGTAVKEGDTVTIILSSGKEKVMKLVPDLRNLSEEKAIQKLKDQGLTAGNISYKNSDEVKEGFVITQSYSVNKEVEEGTAVDFTVSKGPKAKEYVYKGSVTITDNPFISEDEEGVITLELTQDGEQTNVYESVLTYDDFPLTKQIIGNSESDGEIRMYLDGERLPGQWTINFTKVEK